MPAFKQGNDSFIASHVTKQEKEEMIEMTRLQTSDDQPTEKFRYKRLTTGRYCLARLEKTEEKYFFAHGLVIPAQPIAVFSYNPMPLLREVRRRKLFLSSELMTEKRIELALLSPIRDPAKHLPHWQKRLIEYAEAISTYPSEPRVLLCSFRDALRILSSLFELLPLSLRESFSFDTGGSRVVPQFSLLISDTKPNEDESLLVWDVEKDKITLPTKALSNTGQLASTSRISAELLQASNLDSSREFHQIHDLLLQGKEYLGALERASYDVRRKIWDLHSEELLGRLFKEESLNLLHLILPFFRSPQWRRLLENDHLSSHALTVSLPKKSVALFLENALVTGHTAYVLRDTKLWKELEVQLTTGKYLEHMIFLLQELVANYNPERELFLLEIILTHSSDILHFSRDAGFKNPLRSIVRQLRKIPKQSEEIMAKRTLFTNRYKPTFWERLLGW